MARKQFIRAALLCLAFSVLAPAWAAAFEFGFNGVRFNGVLLGAVPVPAGADIELRLPLAGNGLFFSLRLAGGYEDRQILRNPLTGAPVVEPLAVDDEYWFNWPNGQVDTGLLLRRGAQTLQSPKIEFFALARGRYESNASDRTDSHFLDANSLVGLSGLAGVGIDTVTKEASRMKHGYAGELSLEYGPGFLGFAGGQDFYRANLTLEGYLPLLSAGTDDRNAISVYAGGYLTGDYAGGSSVPLYVLTSFGGRMLRDGLGDSIRGYQSWGYEAAVKAEASVDLRVVGPALFGVLGLRPIAYLFGDAGYYAGLYNCSSVLDKDGLILSTGGGLALGILDFAYLGVRAGYKFPIDDPLYDYYFPAGDRFFWGITFMLHF